MFFKTQKKKWVALDDIIKEVRAAYKWNKSHRTLCLLKELEKHQTSDKDE
jgi:hypothetical protein